MVLSLIILFRFALLEKEIKATFDAQDKEASMIIEKLRQFIHIDIDAIPHVMVSKQQSRFESLLITMATHCLYNIYRRKCVCL